MTRHSKTLLALLPAMMLLPSALGAQSPGTPATKPSLAAAQAAQGSLIVEPIRNSWVIAPDVKVTEIDGSTRTLVGGYGGAVLEDTLLVGAGGYWLADTASDRKMAYGGFVTQWTLPAGRHVRFGVRALVGGGHATLGRTASFRVPVGFDMGRDWDRMGSMGAHGWPSGITMTTVSRRLRYETGFLVAEPQADVLLKLGPWLALNAGAGYRGIAWANGLERDLRGAVGSLSVRIGRN